MKMQSQKQIGENLRLLRNAHGYTQMEVAEELHIGRSTYTLYELGRKLPPVDLIVDMAAFYDVRLDLLFNPKVSLYVKKMFSREQNSKDMVVLIDTFCKLPPVAQGKLMERAATLLEDENGCSSDDI